MTYTLYSRQRTRNGQKDTTTGQTTWTVWGPWSAWRTTGKTQTLPVTNTGVDGCPTYTPPGGTITFDPASLVIWSVMPNLAGYTSSSPLPEGQPPLYTTMLGERVHFRLVPTVMVDGQGVAWKLSSAKITFADCKVIMTGLGGNAGPWQGPPNCWGPGTTPYDVPTLAQPPWQMRIQGNAATYKHPEDWSWVHGTNGQAGLWIDTNPPWQQEADGVVVTATYTIRYRTPESGGWETYHGTVQATLFKLGTLFYPRVGDGSDSGTAATTRGGHP